MNNKLITLVITLVVGIILAGSLLVPVLNDVTTTEKTFANTGYYTYDPVVEDTNTVLTWAKTAPDVITIGDNDVTMPEGNGSWTIVGSENFTLRYYRNTTVSGVQMYSDVGYISVNTGSTADSATMTVTASTLTVTDGTNTRTPTMGTHGFVLNPTGDGSLTLKYSDESAYMKGGSDIYLCGTTMVIGSGTNDFVGVFGYGTLDDGLTMSSFYGKTSPNTVTIGDVTASYAPVNGYIDLYKLDKFTFPLTQNSATVTATYSYFVVPTEVTAELSQHLTPGQIALMGAIPVLVIVALLVVAVGVVARRND